ncbi:hypothetical protein J6590_071408 [Homalodisca vitripennis]|nr:hypothetical protein J6590_071408 [Homalodisca vitripennis]
MKVQEIRASVFCELFVSFQSRDKDFPEADNICKWEAAGTCRWTGVRDLLRPQPQLQVTVSLPFSVVAYFTNPGPRPTSCHPLTDICCLNLVNHHVLIQFTAFYPYGCSTHQRLVPISPSTSYVRAVLNLLVLDYSNENITRGLTKSSKSTKKKTSKVSPPGHSEEGAGERRAIKLMDPDLPDIYSYSMGRLV